MLTPAQAELVDAHYGWALRAAAIWSRRHSVPHRWHDDIVAAGAAAIISVAARYQPDRGCTFRTFAAPRIEGAAHDELRRLWIGRNGGQDRTGDTADIPDITDRQPEPGAIGDVEDLAAIYRLFDQLDPADRQIACWYFQDGLNMGIIGARMGVTDSRICQRMRTITRRLRTLACRHELVEAV